MYNKWHIVLYYQVSDGMAEKKRKGAMSSRIWQDLIERILPWLLQQGGLPRKSLPFPRSYKLLITKNLIIEH